MFQDQLPECIKVSFQQQSSFPAQTFVGDVNYEGITRPHIQYNRDVYFLEIIASVQGGRSWQAFSERKKCLQFFRRMRICQFTTKGQFFTQFYLVLPSFTQFYIVFTSFTQFLLRFTQFYLVLPSFYQFYLVFTQFYLVLPIFFYQSLIFNDKRVPSYNQFVKQKQGAINYCSF